MANTASRLNPEIRREMRSILADPKSAAFDYIGGDPEMGFVNLTALAEMAAKALGHDEWLDHEDHPVWDVAIEAAEAHARSTA